MNDMERERAEVKDIDRSLYDFRYEEKETDFYRVKEGLTPDIVREISKVVPDEVFAPILAEVPGVAHRSQCTLSSLWMLSKALVSWSEQAAA